MTCKDCIHFESCKSLYETHGEGLSGDSYVCDFFKGRSRFVELPDVGEKVYELCRVNPWGDYIIGESIVKGLIVDTTGTAFDYELLGKRFFLTHEEAEQALKERGGND